MKPASIVGEYVEYVKNHLNDYAYDDYYRITSIDFKKYVRSRGVSASPARLWYWFRNYIEDSLRARGFMIVSVEDHGRFGVWVFFKAN